MSRVTNTLAAVGLVATAVVAAPLGSASASPLLGCTAGGITGQFRYLPQSTGHNVRVEYQISTAGRTIGASSLGYQDKGVQPVVTLARSGITQDNMWLPLATFTTRVKGAVKVQFVFGDSARSSCSTTFTV